MRTDSSNFKSLPPLLVATSVGKSFAGVRALKDASLELLAGEVHALIGENGAGKSTLTKILTGALRADAGTLEVGGQSVAENDPKVARALGIAAIYQQPSLFPDLSVAENIALALEAGSTRWRVDWQARSAQARKLLSSLGSSLDAERLAGTLSMAEQQIVEIAKAIGAEARILLMDEPTALLTDHEVDNLFALIRRLRAEGVGLLYISHRLEEIVAIADRITVMRDGETIACRRASEVDRAELIRLMVGRPVAAIFPKRAVPQGEVVLELRGLCQGAVGLRDISFSIRAGEVFGLAGLVGSGRTELARTLFGLTPCDTGIVVHGRACTIGSPQDAIRLGIGYVPEDRRQHGVVLEMEVAANISMASLGTVSRWGLIDREREAAQAEEYRQVLSIKTASVFAAAGTLSGGNQQKVALARWLAIAPKIVILDEPTQGVDVGSKAEIHELTMQLAERGVAVLLISSELTEVLAMSDRVGVMRSGRLQGVLARTEATQEKVMALAFGHAVDGMLEGAP